MGPPDRILLELAGVGKEFGDVVALADLHLRVANGEFLSLLGPSGCGKTTLLRIVAGFDPPTRGRVLVSGRDITYQPPYRRPVNTVLQRSVLFPHLSVFENVAFGLKLARCPKKEIVSRVRAMLALVRLEGFESRRSDQLSGGQAQRVSLARALVNKPLLLLLDEPLSALDLKVRQEMQGELRRIHRETGTTFVYVTHDQQEAMSMSDRVVVMNHGVIEQVGTPAEIYHRPATRFVASFVGNSNLLPAEVIAADGGESARVRISGTELELDVVGGASLERGTVVLRPEVLRLTARGGGGLPGAVLDTAFLGSSVLYSVDVGGHELRVQELGADIRPSFAIGDRVEVHCEPGRAVLLRDEPPGSDG